MSNSSMGLRGKLAKSVGLSTFALLDSDLPMQLIKLSALEQLGA